MTQIFQTNLRLCLLLATIWTPAAVANNNAATQAGESLWQSLHNKLAFTQADHTSSYMLVQRFAAAQASAENLESLESFLIATDTPRGEARFVGGAALQAELIREQIWAQLGRSSLEVPLKGSYDEAMERWLKRLYAAAQEHFESHPELIIGQPLDKPCPVDLIWPERYNSSAGSFWFPRLCLSSKTLNKLSIKDQELVFAGPADIASLSISKSQLALKREGFLTVLGDLDVRLGDVVSEDSAKVTVGGDLSLNTSQIRAGGDLKLHVERHVSTSSMYYSFKNGPEPQDNVRIPVSGIHSETGSVELVAKANVVLLGTEVSAGEKILIDAGGSVTIASQPVGREYNDNNTRRMDVEHLASTLSAEQAIEILSDENIHISASEITSSESHIALLAATGIVIENSDEQHGEQVDFRNGGSQKYIKQAVGSLLSAGQTIKLQTESGDIRLKASEFVSDTPVSIDPKNGRLILQISVDQDTSSTHWESSTLITQTSHSSGHQIETAQHNKFSSGYETTAVEIEIEVGISDDQNLEQRLDALQVLPGLEWIKEVRKSADPETWKQIKLAHQSWDETHKSMTPEFSAFVAIAVTALTYGATASLAAALTYSSIQAAAVAAGLNAIVVQGSIALGNAVVSQDFEGAFDRFTSNDTLKSIAIAMVTAGVLEAADIQFFDASSGEAAAQSVNQAAWSTPITSLSPVDQVKRALMQSVIKSGVQTLADKKSFKDFEKSFQIALVHNAVTALGSNLASEIGEAYYNNDINLSIQLISHATIGCVTGSGLTFGNDKEDQTTIEEGCASGAFGSVVGELIGKAYTESVTDNLSSHLGEILDGTASVSPAQIQQHIAELRQQGVNIAKLGAAFSALLAGLDVDISAATGEFTARENALGKFHEVVFKYTMAYIAAVYLGNGMDLNATLEDIATDDHPAGWLLGEALEQFGKAIGKGVELSLEKFPEQTEKTLELLEEVDGFISAGVEIVTDSELGTMSIEEWKKLDENVRNALIAAGKVGSVVIPPGTLGKLAQMRKMGLSPNWVRVPGSDAKKIVNSPEYDNLSDYEKFLLDTPNDVIDNMYDIGLENRDDVLELVGSLEGVGGKPGEMLAQVVGGATKIGIKTADGMENFVDEFKATKLGAGSGTFTSGRLPRNGQRNVLFQGDTPTCGPTSCGMVLDTLGNPVKVSELIKQTHVSPNGITSHQIADLLTNNGANASVKRNMTVSDIAGATKNGKPSIVAVLEGGNGHAVVVDGITKRMGRDVVAIRDPWGAGSGRQYFETVESFSKRFLGEGVVID